ncbi:hypothetical protein LTR53_018172, partial [Teratosphaeriaceae sp. CCFEE 6253]
MYNSRPRPVPSTAALRALRQLAYISSGTVAGAATLCAEERRRRTQVVQRIADNAKRLRQHSRYYQNVASATHNVEDGAVRSGALNGIPDAGGDGERRQKRQRSTNAKREELVTRSPDLPSSVEKGYQQVGEQPKKEAKVVHFEPYKDAGRIYSTQDDGERRGYPERIAHLHTRPSRASPLSAGPEEDLPRPVARVTRQQAGVQGQLPPPTRQQDRQVNFEPGSGQASSSRLAMRDPSQTLKLPIAPARKHVHPRDRPKSSTMTAPVEDFASLQKQCRAAISRSDPREAGRLLGLRAKILAGAEGREGLLD